MLVKTGQDDILTDDEDRKESGNSEAIIFGDKLVCPYCLRKFERFRERDNHVKMIHEKSSVGKFSCKQCEKSYMSESALNYHVDIVHASRGKDFKCKHCEKSFKHKIGTSGRRCSRSPFRRSSNDVSGYYFHHYFFPPFFSPLSPFLIEGVL